MKHPGDKEGRRYLLQNRTSYAGMYLAGVGLVLILFIAVIDWMQGGHSSYVGGCSYSFSRGWSHSGGCSSSSGPGGSVAAPERKRYRRDASISTNPRTGGSSTSCLSGERCS